MSGGEDDEPIPTPSPEPPPPFEIEPVEEGDTPTEGNGPLD